MVYAAPLRASLTPVLTGLGRPVPAQLHDVGQPARAFVASDEPRPFLMFVFERHTITFCIVQNCALGAPHFVYLPQSFIGIVWHQQLVVVDVAVGEAGAG